MRLPCPGNRGFLTRWSFCAYHLAIVSHKGQLTVMQRYGHLAPRFLENMRSQERVTSESVFQEGNKVNRALVEEVLADLMLPGSTLLGFRNLQEAYERAQRGESCLITMEHYSNFDLPNLF